MSTSVFETDDYAKFLEGNRGREAPASGWRAEWYRQRSDETIADVLVKLLPELSELLPRDEIERRCATLNVTVNRPQFMEAPNDVE